MGDSHTAPKYFAPTNRLKTKAFLLTAAAQGRPRKSSSAVTRGKSWLRWGKLIAANTKIGFERAKFQKKSRRRRMQGERSGSFFRIGRTQRFSRRQK
jgi:hypothetical protein